METTNPQTAAPQQPQQPQQQYAPQQPQQQYAQQQYAQQQPYAQQAYGQVAPPPIFMTEVGKMRLQSAAKWAKNVGVMSIIMLILLLIIFIVAIFITNKASRYAGSYGYYEAHSVSSSVTFVMIAMYLVIVGISIYPITRLLGFKSKVDAAIASNDSNIMAEAYHKLSGYFIFSGVMSIIGLFFMVIYTIAVIAGANTVSHYI